MRKKITRTYELEIQGSERISLQCKAKSDAELRNSLCIILSGDVGGLNPVML